MRYCPCCAQALVDRMIDGLMRKACNAPGCAYVFWDNPLPVVIALVEYEDQIILARNAAWPQGFFSLISGFLEKRENPEQAVIREVAEELGLQARIAGFLGHYSFVEKNQLIIAYWVRAEGVVRLNDELAELRFVPKRTLQPEYFPAELALSAKIVRVWAALAD